MFSRLNSFFGSKPADDGKLAYQPPNVPFPWPRCTRLLVLEDTILAIPSAALGKGEKIGDVIHCDVDAEIRLPTTPSDPLIHLRLKAGMSVWLSKSVQGVVVASDKRPRGIRIFTPDNPTKPLPGEIEEAKRHPNGWVYRIAGRFAPQENVPPEAIVGAWKVDAQGCVVGDFVANGKYNPERWPSTIDENGGNQ